MTPRGRFDGMVHSVFERVCNLKLNDGTFVAVAQKEVSNGPGVILCKTNRGFSFTKHLNTGERFACRGNKLRLGQHLQIDLRDALTWKRRIASAQPEQNSNQWKAYLEYVRDSSTFGRVEEIINGSQQFLGTYTNLISKLQPLVGKGPGLTPLGDDFIVGIAAGMEAYPKSRGVLFSWLHLVHKNTTDMSGRALLYAAQGWFIEDIVEFLGNLSKPTVETMPPRLLSIGDTSGTAMAYGCLVGLQAGKYLPLILPKDAYPVCQYTFNSSPANQAA